MLFNSWAFLVFFPLVTTVYFLLAQRFRNAFLLAASCYFYMNYIPIYILILFFLISLDYSLALFIESVPSAQKKNWMYFSIAANILTLIVFKYFNFFTNHSILLPIGLSFHTMQSMSYVIEVSNERQKAERNFLTYALFVMFFPQLVAGPIERPQTLLKQFYEVHKFEITRAASGLLLMLIGFYKKVVVGDYIAGLVNPVFSNPLQSSGTDCMLAAVTFSFQVYCDFSGYSDIARGAARILGFELSENFAQPFSSRNLGELWRRWHMTLSNWFRDYVFIPLGGSKKSNLRTAFNILFVFLLSGLWHGTGWNFIIWSELNGLMVVLLYFLKRGGWFSGKSVNSTLGVVSTFLYFSFAVIFFRSPSPDNAFEIVSRLFSGGGLTHANAFSLTLSVCLVVSLELIHFLQRNWQTLGTKLVQNLSLRWTAYYVFGVLFFVLTYLSVTHQNEFERPFIYFQF